jgi:hypothetical protein
MPAFSDMFADMFRAMADILGPSFHTSKLPPATVAEMDLDRLMGISVDADGHAKPLRRQQNHPPCDLCDRPVRVENEERVEADGAQPKVRDFD